MNHWIKNKEQLVETSPEFVQTIEDAEKECNWLHESKTDLNNYIIQTDNNETVFCYEKNNVTKSVKQSIEKLKFLERDATIIIGVGGGVLINEILKAKHKKHILIVVEPETSLIYKLFNKYDLTKHLKNSSLQFVTNLSLINSVINICDSYNVIQEWHLLTEQYTVQKPSVYEEFFIAVKNTITQLQCNNGTVANAGKEIALNDIKNLPYVLPHPGVNKLENIFKGKPAVVVNTGPSLAKNIHHLIKNKDKVVIIAVAQVLRILLAYDIKPDFICTVDFGEVNKTHFDGLMDTNIPLIALNRTHAGIIKEWKGQKFIAANYSPGFEDTLAGVINDKGMLDQGGSVSHFAFSAAVKMGCSPIALIGQDLALTESSHNPNADSMGDIVIEDGMIYWNVNDPKSETLNKERHCMGPVVTVPGYYGDTVITNIGLAAFIAAFEGLFEAYKHTGVNIYDATEGGAFIKGSKRISLKEYLKLYAKKKINKKIPEKCISYKDKIIESLYLLKKEILLLNDIIFNCTEALEKNKLVIKEAFKKKRNETSLRIALKANKKYSKKAEELAGKNALVNICIYNISRQIQTREMRVKGKIKHLLKENDDLKIRIERNRLILDSTLKAAKEILACYKETEKIFDEYIKDKNVLFRCKDSYVPDLSDCEIYFKNGNFARPLSDAKLVLMSYPANKIARDVIQKCLIMRDKAISEASDIDNTKAIKYHELVYQARLAGMKNKNFEKAFELLNKAVKLFPDKPEARWGKATCLRHTGKLKEALEEYKKLMKNNTKAIVYQFEYAQTLIEYDLAEGLDYMWSFLTNNPDKYQAFWKKIYLFYKKINREQAQIAYNIYKERFPADENI